MSASCNLLRALHASKTLEQKQYDRVLTSTADLARKTILLLINIQIFLTYNLSKKCGLYLRFKGLVVIRILSSALVS